MKSKQKPWQIWADTGGTFTDCLGLDPQGNLLRTKVLSSSALRGTIRKQINTRKIAIQTNWHPPDGFFAGFTFRQLGADTPGIIVQSYDASNHQLSLAHPWPDRLAAGSAFEVISPDEAPVLAARMLTKTGAKTPLPPMHLRLATTRGTNALLENKGANLAFFVTRGFRDLLRIGTQQRPDLFALDIRKPEPLHARVIQVPERVSANGAILLPMDVECMRKAAKHCLENGIETAAIALMHSYRYPAHELALAELLRQEGFTYIATSCELAPFIKLLDRAETAVVDAYIGPVIQNYLERVRAAIGDAEMRIISSAGGLTSHRDYRAKDSLLSGPAGGVVGASEAARRSGFSHIISFDMGGTSTDVARMEKKFEYVFEQTIGDAHLVAPALAIETVAAGGGSICQFRAQRLQVGPESAGADPGPACYGSGGPLTITDVNLLLGRLLPEQFGIPVHRQDAVKASDQLLTRLRAAGRKIESRESVLAGLLEIANERMADAIRSISVRRGYDPTTAVLVAFGGAGAQHGCAVAEKLGMQTVLVPADASLLSAFGLGHAAIERFAERQILQPLAGAEKALQGFISHLVNEAKGMLLREGIAAKDIHLRRCMVDMRIIGQDYSLALEYTGADALPQQFADAYQQRYGYWPETSALEIVAARAIAATRPASATTHSAANPELRPTSQEQTTSVYVNNSWRDVDLYFREKLEPGNGLQGPALILEAHSATWVPPRWQAHVDQALALVLTRNSDQHQ